MIKENNIFEKKNPKYLHLPLGEGGLRPTSIQKKKKIRGYHSIYFGKNRR